MNGRMGWMGARDGSPPPDRQTDSSRTAAGTGVWAKCFWRLSFSRPHSHLFSVCCGPSPFVSLSCPMLALGIKCIAIKGARPRTAEIRLWQTKQRLSFPATWTDVTTDGETAVVGWWWPAMTSSSSSSARRRETRRESQSQSQHIVMTANRWALVVDMHAQPALRARS